MAIEKIEEDTSQQHISTTYERVKKKIEHEDKLVNHRLGWMISTQGFFYDSTRRVQRNRDI